MEIRLLELPLRAFGAESTAARVELDILSPADRLKRAGVIIGISLAVAVVAIPIPLVHLVLVPGALVLGIIFSLVKLSQHEIFRSGPGSLSPLRCRAEVHSDGSIQAAEKALLQLLSAGAHAGGSYHLTAALPHMKPDPNAVITRRSPRSSRPLRTHSSSAMGMVAAVVFP